MQVNSRFSVSVHILLCISIFEEEGVTSKVLSKSVNTNAVVVRRLLSLLKSAGIIDITKKGSRIIKDTSEITLLTVYNAIYSDKEKEMFSFHNPNEHCPVGCVMHDVLHEYFNVTREMFEKSLNKTNMKDMVLEIKKRKKHIPYI